MTRLHYPKVTENFPNLVLTVGWLSSGCWRAPTSGLKVLDAELDSKDLADSLQVPHCFMSKGLCFQVRIRLIEQFHRCDLCSVWLRKCIQFMFAFCFCGDILVCCWGQGWQMIHMVHVKSSGKDLRPRNWCRPSKGNHIGEMCRSFTMKKLDASHSYQ